MIAQSNPAVIALKQVRVNNLRGIDVDIPLGRLSVVTGVSGAGKSSLVFDTLFAEAQRRYLESFSASIRQHMEQFDRPEAETLGPMPPAIAVGRRAESFGAGAKVGDLTEIAAYLRLLWSRAGTLHCRQCGQPVRAYQASDVASYLLSMPPGVRVTLGFPSAPEQGDVRAWAAGLCEEGFVRARIDGQALRLDEAKLPDTVSEAVVLVDRLETGKLEPRRLTESLELCFARGGGRLMLATEAEDRAFDRRPVCHACRIDYEAPAIAILDEDAELAQLVRLGAWSLARARSETHVALRDFLQTLALTEVGHQLLRDELLRRLDALVRVCVGYLTSARPAASLAAGEVKRLRLANALAAQLVQALYLFEEPSAGLHPRDRRALLEELQRLRDGGNTVVAIEHDLDIVAAADHVVDLGPGAGEEGGQVVYQGPPAGLKNCAASLTGAHLAGGDDEAVPRPYSHGWIALRGARTHNLQNLTVEFPLGVLCVVTGPSGAGKRSLIEHTLYPALAKLKHGKAPQTDAIYDDVLGAGQIDDVVLMDQQPLTRTARSNPATYVKVMDDIRELFAETTDAKIRNLGPGAFSFNQPGGRCEACAGQGVQTVDMQFLADVSVACPECHGARFTREVLKIKVRNLDIAEVLNLTIREGFRFFRAQAKIQRRLKFLLDVGLDYLRLGQPIETLSAGECQRLKLAGQLASSRKTRSLFLLLEPTAGLHPADVLGLLDCFARLLETGRSLILLEHNLTVIQNSDYVIDMSDGAIVARGTPEEVARAAASATGACLAHLASCSP